MDIHRHLPACILIASLASPLAAQLTRVVPGDHATVEGASASGFPLGYYHGRSQQIWRGSAVTQALALIDGIAFRRDTNLVKEAFTARTYTSATVKIGTTSKDPDAMSATFQDNITSTMTTVVSGNLNFPAQHAVTGGPAAFDVALQWSTPFVFSRAGNQHLLLDMTLPGSPQKSRYELDAISQSRNGGAATSYGVAGRFQNPETFRLWVDPVQLHAGGTFDISCGRFQKQYTGKLVLGFSNKVWNGVPLPLDLAVIGAPGNHLYTSLDLQLGFDASNYSFGYLSNIKSPVPNDPVYNGLTLYSQAYYGDGRSIVTTEGLEMQFGKAGGTTATTNTVGSAVYTDSRGSYPWGPDYTGGPVTRFSGSVF